MGPMLGAMRSGHRGSLLAALAAVAMLLAAPGARAAQGVAGAFGSPLAGAGAGQLDKPAGVAVDEATGDVYVADSANNRVEEFSVAGAFVRAWGAGVGPKGEAVCVPEQIPVGENCKAGIASAAAGGMSDPQGVAVDQATGDVYVSDEGNLRIDEFDPEGGFIRAWGAGVVASGPGRVEIDAQQTVTVTASGGTFTLTFGANTTAPIAYDAPVAGPSSVQKALEGLASIGAGNVAVGGPDGGPYSVTFTGALADTDVAQMTADGAALTGPGAGVAVATATVGASAAEVCGEGDTCQAGVSAATGGAFATAFTGYLAVVPAGAANAGDVIVADPGNARVQEFTATGLFVRVYGRDVNATALAEAGASAAERDLCTAASGDLCQAGAPGAGVGQFAAGEPTRVAADATGAIYTAESSAGFRVQKLTPVNGGLSAEVFAEQLLSGGDAGDAPSDVAVDPATDDVYVVRGYPEGAGEPPALFPERRVLVLSATGAPLETDMTGDGVEAVAGLALDAASGRQYVSSTTRGERVYVLEGVPAPIGPPYSECPNEALRRENDSTGLPDCRAYEQVTPNYQDGFEFITETETVSADGAQVFAGSLGTLAGSEASQPTTEGSEYRFDRTPTGWTTTALEPAGADFANAEYVDGAPDGTTAWLLRPLSERPLRQRDIYIRAPGGALTAVGPLLSPGAVENNHTPEMVAESRDLSHFIFRSKTETGEAELWPFDSSVTSLPDEDTYEYSGTGNAEPELVGVHGGRGSRALISRCGISLGSGTENVYNAMSASGETVFITASHVAACPGEQPPVNEVYARIAGEKTLAISEPATPAGESCTGVCEEDRGEENGHHRSPGLFQGASEDGAKVFFTTEQPLLNGDEDEDNDLYMAEIEGTGQGAAISRLVQVSHDPNAGQAAEVQGVARVAEDGERVYYVARGVLTSEANGLGQSASPGADNLYVYDTDSGRTAFVATLAPSDSNDWTDVEGPVQATPDGGFLLFSSRADPTGEAQPAGATLQLYRYEASTGALLRVSIGQQGAFPCAASGRVEAGFNCDGATGTMELPPLAGVRSRQRNEVAGRAIAEDGSYVFFASTDGLTPGAQNGEKINSEGKEALNVYEWEADHTGACQIYTGCVSLISDGRDISSVEGYSTVALIGADAAGENVFFRTSDALAAGDENAANDIYDARVDGGFPAPTEAFSCSGGECQPGASPAQTPPPAPGSAPLAGAGELVSPLNAPPPRAAAAPKRPSAATARTRALARALRACRTRAKRARRRACEAAARRRYGARAKARKSRRERRQS